MKTIYMAASNTSNITSINVVGGHGMQTATATIDARNTDLDIGDTVSVNIGYDDDHGTVFTGYVKSINKSEASMKYTINAIDTLVRAMDYFIVSSDPDTPFTRSNITAENLIRDVLALSGITNYDGHSSNFTLAVQKPVEINLTSAYDYCKFIADLLAWHLYADLGGVVHFEDRKPYITGGDTSTQTIQLTQILNLDYSEDANNLRNRVVLYGAEGITAEASAASPYLPSGFYKSCVVSAPIIDSQSYADQCVAYNLALYNRLTKAVNTTILGDHSIIPRTGLTLDIGVSKVDDLWYVYGVSHTANESGYMTELELRN